MDPMSPYGAELEELAIRRKYADALRQQAMQPVQGAGMAGRTVAPIHWTQGLAQMLRGVGADMTDQQVSGQRKDLSRRYQGDVDDRMRRAMAMARGTPMQATEDASGNADVQQQAIPPDLMGAAGVLGDSPSPMHQQIAAKAFGEAFKMPEPYTLAQGAQRRSSQGQLLAENPPEFKPDRPQQSQLSVLQAELETIRRANPNDPRIPAFLNAIRKESETAKQISPTVVNQAQPAAPVAVLKKDGTGIELVSREEAIRDRRTPAAQDADTQGAIAAARGKAKIVQGMPQAKLRVGSMTQNLDRLESAMQELHDDKGLPNITGTVAGRTWNLTNTATGAQAKLNSIKSQIFQSSLQAMREASKTGGAVGNVSDKEGDKLERTLAALDQAQDTTDFKKQLNKAMDQVRHSKELIQTAFDEQYGEAGEYSGPDRRAPLGNDPLRIRK